MMTSEQLVEKANTMTVEELSGILQSNGIVGAGGAGFPTYKKLDKKADTILLNCAECEPLLKLHRQLLREHVREILEAFQMVADVLEAGEAVVCVKEEYRETVEALRAYLGDYPKVRLHLLQSAYPMGDEVVLIYEATGRVVPPGGLPIQVGIVVFNVETMYNVYRAVAEDKPVTDKVVSIVGAVRNPVTLRLPLGTSIEEAVSMAGGATEADVAYLIGGPMMGNVGNGAQPVTKTTNAVLVLPKEHTLIRRRTRNASIDLKRAASACCQCETCTDLCPRHALGHPITPHKFMRSAANQDFRDLNVFLDTFFCSSCGLCELYSCPQGLSPRSLIADYKKGLQRSGVKAQTGVKPAPVKESRAYRKVPEERLEARLGLHPYDVPAPLLDDVQKVRKVQILLSQHIGAPAVPCVQAGDPVTAGQRIADPAAGLSVAIHASIDGRITAVTERYIQIEVI